MPKPISYDEALARIAQLAPRGKEATVSLDQAHGAILAKDVRMQRDQPPFDRATMDGYALNPIAGQSSYRVSALSAGGRLQFTPAPGEGYAVIPGILPSPYRRGAHRHDGGEAQVEIPNSRP